jgi:hypothetical protein
MITLDRKVQPHSQVVDTKLDDGEVVLLHLEGKHYFSLNLTGGRIWQGVKQGLRLNHAAITLSSIQSGPGAAAGYFDLKPDLVATPKQIAGRRSR